jgi:predicted outer membrane repeat protein
VGGVCAADDISDEIMSNDCQDTLEIEQNDIYTTGESSFSSLADEIENASTVLDLSQNYVFNNATDYELNEGIVINKSDFTINGNDYTIDGNNLARIFNIIGGDNITISNLNFVNGKGKSGGAIYTVPSITFINVTFAENSAMMAGAVSSTQKAVFNNVTFINNTAMFGGAIYSEEGYLEIINCQFNNNTATWGGSIYCKNETRISNSAFRNSKSSYGAAIYAENMFVVKNSTFENLYANETAGAIGIKGFDYAEIDGCTFTNTESRKNGGAVFIDIGLRETGTSSITNSKFISSSGDYGGAFVQLGGKIFIGGCEFTNNSAIYDGGAIYLSYLSAVINNTLVNENKISYENLSCGGGLYCDVFNITIENSNFTDNAIQGIYAYDSELNMKNIIFSNNGEAVHGVFLIYDLKNITLGNDTLFLNDTNYDTDFYEIAKNLVLINNVINVAALPSRYDSRDWGWVSSVKDQGDMGSCWTFGTCGALESALLKATGIEYDFSENNMQNSMLQYSKYGIKGEEEGGAREQGLEYVLSWFGVMPSEFDTYDQLGKLSPLITSNDKIHIFDAAFANPRKRNG